MIRQRNAMIRPAAMIEIALAQIVVNGSSAIMTCPGNADRTDDACDWLSEG
jgi:hypothetical protein